jgi:type IV pilus assembly protein PilX
MKTQSKKLIEPCAMRESTPKQAGISLIVVLIMLVIIGLTSASAIRSATNGEKLTNNLRMQNLAQQYAEAALKYCENELTKADGSRVSTLQEANIVTVAYGDPTAWFQTVTWTGTGGASASKTTVPESQIKSSDSSFKPTHLPECVAEKQILDAGATTYVITARGFSTDYTADTATGKTTRGSVVWLQSTSYLN